MRILKELPKLIEAGVITQDTADRIRHFYDREKDRSGNRIFIIFGILGSILIGLGIILIVAHNWDIFSRSVRTFFAFLPLLLGQLVCGYVLLRQRGQIAWREGSSAFLFFAVGTSIALVSQIYNIPGGTGPFLLTWMLLCSPLIYLMNSSVSSLLYICGITYYASHVGYWHFPTGIPYLYLVLLLIMLPYYYRLLKKNASGNFTAFHNWLVPLSLAISLGTFAKSSEEWLFVAYSSLFGFYYLIGKVPLIEGGGLRRNGYKILGVSGTTVLLLILSFRGIWSVFDDPDYIIADAVFSPEFITASVVTIAAAGLLIWLSGHGRIRDFNPFSFLFLTFIPAFIAGIYSPAGVVMINLYILGSGVMIIRQGATRDHLGILNFGLLIITALIICRFFDTNLDFVYRGVLFVIVGAGFFAANYSILKKRKANAN